MRKMLVTAGLAVAIAAATCAQSYEVKIVGRQDSSGGYSYVVPGYTYSSYQSNPAWTGKGTTGYGVQTSGAMTSVPAQQHSYSVRGAVLSLELPDGRIAVVNCSGKLNWTDFHHANQMERSCRIPPDAVTSLRADFNGTSAKLSWSWQEEKLVSISRRKIVTHKESETYKLVDVLVPAKTTSPAAPKQNP